MINLESYFHHMSRLWNKTLINKSFSTEIPADSIETQKPLVLIFTESEDNGLFIRVHGFSLT